MPITILDGGMSRELMRLNAPFRQPEWSALSLYKQPSAVQQVHENFIANGAQSSLLTVMLLCLFISANNVFIPMVKYWRT